MSHTPRDLLHADCAYDVLAPAYDLLTADYAYAPWLEAIAGLARSYGLAGRRALDVACGMAAVARDKLAGRADVFVDDMRELLVLWNGAPARLDEPGGRAIVAMDVPPPRGRPVAARQCVLEPLALPRVHRPRDRGRRRARGARRARAAVGRLS